MAELTQHSNNHLHHGYISAEGRRRYSIIVGIAGIIFFSLQVLAPLLIMLFSMRDMFAENLFERGKIVEGSKTYWNGRLWYLKEKRFQEDKKNRTLQLVSKSLSDSESPKTAATLKGSSGNLLPEGDKLWLISDDTIFVYENNKLTTLASSSDFSEVSHPFIYNGYPAVIKRTDSPEFGIYIFKEKQWHFQVPFLMEAVLEDLDVELSELVIVMFEDKPHFFLEYDNILYYRDSISTEGKNKWDIWEPVCTTSHLWTAAVINSELSIFNYKYPDLTVLTITNRKPNLLLTQPIEAPKEISILPLEDSKKYMVSLDSYFNSSCWFTINEGKVVKEEKGLQPFFPMQFYGKMMYIYYLPMMILPLLFALILSPMMRNYRVHHYVYEGKDVQFASVWRRAVAQMTDAITMGSPVIALIYHFKIDKLFSGEMPNPVAFMQNYMLFFGSVMAWGICVLLLFSYLEGRWGQTPGKYLLRIRVIGMDIKSCGFGRGFIRNVLVLVDGFFGYMVGLLLVAFTENWQRLGDLAARTIVINKRRDTE